MHRYNVYVLKMSTTRKDTPSDLIFWHVRVNADGRLEALKKALPRICKEVLPHVDASITYVSVFVGQYKDVIGAACRLTPIQVIRETGEIREHISYTHSRKG